MIQDRLSDNFTTELFAYALNRKSTFEIVKAYLKFSYLQTEAEKKLWQWCTRYYDRTGRVPTFGQIQQEFGKNEKILDLLVDISDVEVGDEREAHSAILETFQEYLKQMKFLESNDRIVDVYNRGDKEQAYKLFVKLAEEMDKFSILEASFEPVFAGFEKRQTERHSVDHSLTFKVATMIDELDEILDGGCESTEYILWLGASGAGKSQLLTHLGITSARQGYRVAHFSLEGTKKQCLDRYDAAWTGTLYRDMKVGEVTEKKMKALKKIVERMKRNDIYVSSCEDWGGKSLTDVRKELKDIEKKYGKIDVIIIDYLELLEVGDGKNYGVSDERFRQQKLSKAMKTLAMEFNAVVFTATQANTPDKETTDDPDFVFSRYNINEDKGKIRPADGFFTLNFTSDERQEQFMRIYIDKAREHAGGQIIHICNNFAYSRFYDGKRTAEVNESDGWSLTNKDDEE